MNRILLCLLAALFLAAWAPQNSSAQTWTGNGPHSISSTSDLTTLASEVTGGNAYQGVSFELANDIDLTGISWAPIGAYGSPFKGNFDGQGYTISNLTINDASLEDAGLFGPLNGATVKNLVLDVNITAKGYVGGVASYVEGGSIENCTVSGTISANDNIVGGIVGQIKSGGTMKNCSSSANVSTTHGYIGGVAG
ncbi:MAG: fimbrillin family protein, partial [Tannerellaceae bacterium]|nr:fimbrillin family protein [Tannerellaceae bacterium]